LALGGLFLPLISFSSSELFGRWAFRADYSEQGMRNLPLSLVLGHPPSPPPKEVLFYPSLRLVAKVTPFLLESYIPLFLFYKEEKLLFPPLN